MNKREIKKRTTKKSKKAKKFRFYFFVLIILGLSLFGFKFIEKNNNIKEASAMKETPIKEEEESTFYLTNPSVEHKELGSIESIIEYGSEGLIGAHYPVFENKNIDNINKDLVNGYIETFKKEIKNNKTPPDPYHKYELSIDYETYKGPDDIVSIIYFITESGPYLAHPDYNIITKAYDLEKDKEVNLNEIIGDEGLTYVSNLSREYFMNNETYKDSIDPSLFEDGIKASESNYSNFILKDQEIVFIFDKYQLFSGYFGTPSIEILYSKLIDFLKTNPVDPPKREEINIDPLLENVDEAIKVEIPRRHIDPDKPMVALTFDDGPNKKVTGPILDVLKEYDSVATFFILGNRASDNADILKRILEEGSEIGNHSYNHKELTKLSYDELRGQIENTQEAVYESTGSMPKIMRPTYGSFNDNLKKEVEMPLILWSIDTLDWKSKDAKKVTSHVLSNIRDGDIVLMHDIYDSTGLAVKSLVPQLINKGYQLVTVSELFEARGLVLEDGQIYNQAHKK